MQIRVVGIVVAFLAVSATGAFAQSGQPPTVLYHLQPGSTYEEGCYEPCQCPILQAPLEGTFGLTLLPTGGPLNTFAVDAAALYVPALDKSIEGAGFYTRAGELDQLELDLQVDGGSTWRFGSGGLVPAGAEFPAIDIVVSVHQFMECFDYSLHLVASPAAPAYPGPSLVVARSELSWSAVPGATGYDVVCGDLPYLHASGDFTGSTDLCLGDDHSQTSLPYDLTPGDGEALWFLVREAGGSWDSGDGHQVGSRDPGIAASPPACP